MIGEIGNIGLKEGIAHRAEKLGGVAASQEARERQKAAQEFASFLFLEVLKAMRASIPRSGLLENEPLSRDIYTSMMDSEISRVMARRDSTGLTKMIERALDGVAQKASADSVAHFPAQGVVSSGFGSRSDPLKGGEHFHSGIDIAAPAGGPIKAAASGKVIYSGWAEGYGNLIALDHGNGIVTRYAHNAVHLVSTGETVAGGQDIGLVGSTGRSTGPHLHFEVLQGDQPVDPLLFLAGQHNGMKLASKS